LKAVIDLLESVIDLLESVIDLLESIIDLLKSVVDIQTLFSEAVVDIGTLLLEALIYQLEAFIYVRTYCLELPLNASVLQLLRFVDITLRRYSFG
jgi:hypothetical protein